MIREVYVYLGAKGLAAGAGGRGTLRVEVPEFMPGGELTSSLSTETSPPAPRFS